MNGELWIDTDGVPATMAEAQSILEVSLPDEEWRVVSYLAFPGRWGSAHARRGPIGNHAEEDNLIVRFGERNEDDFR